MAVIPQYRNTGSQELVFQTIEGERRVPPGGTFYLSMSDALRQQLMDGGHIALEQAEEETHSEEHED